MVIWCVFLITDPGPGILHDDVLSVGESRDFLRLKKNSVLLHTWIVFHQRGTNIDPGSSPIFPRSLLLQTLLCPLCDIPYRMVPVHHFPC